MKIKLLLSLLLTFIFSTIQAQFNETIVSGRPGVSNGPFGVGKRVYQIQTGLRYEKWKINSGTRGEIFDNSTVLRAGIFEGTELRGSYQYNFIDKITYNPSERASFYKNSFNGVFNSSFGIRQNLTKQKGIIPSTGLQLTAQFGGNKDYKREGTEAELRILLQYKFFKKLVLNTNLTASTLNDNLKYVFSFSYPINKSIRLVTEAYGTKYSEDSYFPNSISTSFNLGLGFLATNNLQIDLFGGFGSEPYDLEYSFLSTGLSYRFHKR